MWMPFYQKSRRLERVFTSALLSFPALGVSPKTRSENAYPGGEPALLPRGRSIPYITPYIPQLFGTQYSVVEKATFLNCLPNLREKRLHVRHWD
jgi:hypothetical protein